MFSPPTIQIRKLNQNAYFRTKGGEARFKGRAARELSQLGAFIRQTAIRSIRRVGKKGKPSKPGSPPKQRATNDFVSLRNIQFYYIPFREAVIIGPVALNMQKWYHPGTGLAPGSEPTSIGSTLGIGQVPRVLEHGGFIGVHEEQLSNGQWVPIGRKRFASATERLIPVWLATAAEKAASRGVYSIRKGTKTINFYRVPTGVRQRVRMVKIDPRPFMVPAMQKELAKIKARREAVMTERAAA